jgi:hypothetical protein
MSGIDNINIEKNNNGDWKHKIILGDDIIFMEEDQFNVLASKIIKYINKKIKPKENKDLVVKIPYSMIKNYISINEDE